MQIILASQSPYRQALLEAAGIPFTAVRPAIDEEHLKDPRLAPRELCLMLAARKAQSLKDLYPKAVIIGSDQLVHFNGEVLGKPGSTKNAESQLSRLQGRTHELLTALHVISGAREESRLSITEITLRKLSSDDIRRYVELDQPVDCAGAYKLERAGICLVESLKGSDHSAIIGLPMMELTDIFLSLNLGFPFNLKQP